MKNTLKFMLMLIGLGFLITGLYLLVFPGADYPDGRDQVYAMIGVGILFFIGGMSMKIK